VNLEGCVKITDKGALRLAKRCRRLRTLYLTETQATLEGVSKLKNAYPHLRVDFEFSISDSWDGEYDSEEGDY
jgi:hypothetical protein